MVQNWQSARAEKTRHKTTRNRVTQHNATQKKAKKVGITQLKVKKLGITQLGASHFIASEDGKVTPEDLRDLLTQGRVIERIFIGQKNGGETDSGVNNLGCGERVKRGEAVRRTGYTIASCLSRIDGQEQ